MKEYFKQLLLILSTGYSHEHKWEFKREIEVRDSDQIPVKLIEIYECEICGTMKQYVIED